MRTLEVFARSKGLFLAALVLVASACGGQVDYKTVEKFAVDPSDESMSEGAMENLTAEERGQRLFSQKGICFSCHGSAGEGTQVAPDLTDDEWIHLEGEVTVAAISAVISAGVSAPKRHAAMMPPKGGGNITEEEVEDIAAYVYSLSKQ